MTTIPTTLGPRRTERGGEPAWTLVGPLDTAAPARVDAAGLITPNGADWSLDWWIGADDRWYFPSREAAVRQQRIGPGPVLQTSVRIPSGDANHRVYGAVVNGREVTVVEVENDSPVPVALALAIRPYAIDGAGEDGSAGGVWPRPMRLANPLLMIDGAAALRLPRPPNQAAAATDGDLADAVVSGEELEWAGGVTTEANNAVFLYPLPHRTSLRFVIPGRTAAENVPDPSAVPDHEAVSRGWSSMVEGTTRFEFPDSGLTQLVGAARARLLLGAGPTLIGAAVGLEPEVGVVLQALAFGRHRSEMVPVLEALADGFPTSLAHDPMAAAELVAALGPMLAVVDAEPEPELVEVAVQVTHLVDRSGDAAAARTARLGLAAVARAAGDAKGAAHLERKLGRSNKAGRSNRGDRGDGVDGSDDAAAALESVMNSAAEASEAGSWSTDSAASAARFVAQARGLLIDDSGDELLLLPDFPTAWRGGNAEVHRAPTRHGELSFGIRWHGARPALLWQLDGPGAVIRCPGLDPDWQTEEPRGETLLAGAADGLTEAPGPGDGFS